MKKRLSRHDFSKPQLICFALVFAFIGGYILLSSQAASSTANVFVSANGSDTGINCKRFTTPVTNPDPSGISLCASFDKAYQVTSPGDIVEVEGGSYPSQTIAYTSAKVDGSHCTPVANNDITNPVADYSGCITFQPAPTSMVNVVSVTTQAPYVRIKDLILSGLNLGSSPAVNGLACSAIKDHDEVADGVTLNGTFTIKGDHNFIINSTIDVGTTYTSASGTSHFNACVQTVGGVTTNVLGNYQGVINTTIRNMIQTQSSNQAGAASFQQQHVAAIHLEGGNHVLIDRNKFINLAGHNLEAQSESGAPSTDWRITNNFFDTICGSQAIVAAKRGGTTVAGSKVITGLSQTSDLAVGEKVSSIFLPQNPDGSNNTTIVSIDSPSQITLSETVNTTGSTTLTFGGTCEDQGGDDVTTSGSALSDVTYSFNTFKTGFPVWTEGSVPMTGTLREIGNIGGGGAPDAFHCSFYKNFDAGVTLDYNVWSSGAKCGPNDVVGAIGFVDSASMDLHIGPSSAYNVVPASVPGDCPAVDIDGDSRPQGAACDAGADEYLNNTANVWVSLTGNDSTCARGDQTKPCLTFNKAYQIANLGDLVEVAAGNYPSQTLSGTKIGGACNGTDGGMASACVTFKPAAGASVSVAGLNIGASFVKIANITNMGALSIIDSSCTSSLPTDVIVQNMTGTDFFIDGGVNIAILGGSFGPVTDTASNIQACGDYYAGPVPTNVLISGVSFHDYHYVTAGTHMECLHISSENGLVVRSNTFTNCGIFDINFNAIQLNGPVMIENNTFDIARGMNDATSGGSSDLGLSPMSNLTVRFNSFLGKWADEDYANPGDTYINTRVYGNIESVVIDSFHCNTYLNSGIIVSYNISSSGGVACGVGSIMADNIFVSAEVATENFHLASAGSLAINFIPVAEGCPFTDIDGDTRPQGSACDVGADEYVLGTTTVAKPGDINSDSHVNILDLSILLSHYGQVATSSQGDLTGDGRVSILDLSILLSHYGS